MLVVKEADKLRKQCYVKQNVKWWLYFGVLLQSPWFIPKERTGSFFIVSEFGAGSTEVTEGMGVRKFV
jgi:hypothetical protein